VLANDPRLAEVSEDRPAHGEEHVQHQSERDKRYIQVRVHFRPDRVGSLSKQDLNIEDFAERGGICVRKG